MSTAKFRSSFQSRCAKKLYLAEDTADVHFLIESDRIPAHKCLLMAASKVFRQRLNELLNKSKDNNTVPIVGTSPSAFKEFLQYFYCDEVELTMNNIKDVMNLGQMYDVSECVDDCVSLWQSNLTADNVLLAYAAAISCDHDDFKSECETIISIHTADVFKSAGFLECDRETLSNILRLESMSCKEVDVFNACMDWVKHASGSETLTKDVIQSHLGNLLFDIRFGAMTIDEFNAINTSYGHLFSRADHKAIVDLIKSKKSQSAKKQSKERTAQRFNGHGRRNPWTQSDVLKCNRELDMASEGYEIEEVETTKFWTNKTLFLTKIVCDEILACFDPMDEPNYLEEELPANFAIYEFHPFDENQENSRVVYADKHIILDSYRTEIELSTPIVIRSGFKYQIKIDIESLADCCTGIKYRNKIRMESGVVVKFDGPIQRGENRGIIWELQFIDI